MPLYFFDTDDGDTLVDDDTGGEYPDLEAAKFEAARALMELARDVLPGKAKRDVAVLVRDRDGPVHAAQIRFDTVALR